MPRIPSYPLIGAISNGDLMIIDDVSQQYTTKSVELQSLKGYFNTGQATTTYVDDKVVSGAGFNTNTGVLTLTRTDGVDVTQDLDGRYALTSDVFSGNYNDLTNKPTIYAEPGIFSGGGTPTLATGVTGPEVRTLIGAGTSNFDGQYSSLTGAPTLYTDSDVDAHLNKTAQTQDNYVLSLSGNDYTWVAQSGGGGGGLVTSLTTNGTSGAATLINGVLNIPEYSGSGSGGAVEYFRKQLQIIFSPAQLNSFSGNSTLELPIIAAPGAKKVIVVDEVSTLKYFPSGSSSGETDYTFSSDLSITLRGISSPVPNSYAGHRAVLNTFYLNSKSTNIGQQISVSNPYTVTNSQDLSNPSVFWNKPLVLQWYNQQSGAHTVGGNGSWSAVLIINYTVLDWSNIL